LCKNGARALRKTAVAGLLLGHTPDLPPVFVDQQLNDDRSVAEIASPGRSH